MVIMQEEEVRRKMAVEEEDQISPISPTTCRAVTVATMVVMGEIRATWDVEATMGELMLRTRINSGAEATPTQTEEEVTLAETMEEIIIVASTAVDPEEIPSVIEARDALTTNTAKATLLMIVQDIYHVKDAETRDT